ncbi:MAG: phosphotransferase [Nitrospirae bacterium]|nr:phosphotransferase [Nitrospirota bacterium]
MNEIRAFILCAGIGERLMPITNRIPKPLLPILGKPIVHLIIEKLLSVPVGMIGINLYHKKEAIFRWINSSPFKDKVIAFPEEPVLGTGGALKNAEEFLKQGTFLVHNSDIMSEVDLLALIEYHLSKGFLATLAVCDCPEFNNVGIDREGFLKGIGDVSGLTRKVTFTGISVYSPEFLRFIPHGASGVVDAWLSAIKAGLPIGTFDIRGSYWKDIGTPSSYSGAVFNALRTEGETVYIHHSSKGCKDITMDGYVVIESGAIVKKGVTLRNCIILPESTINSGQYENSILSSNLKIGLKDSEIFGISEEPILIGIGGSERCYYRVKRNGKSAVLMRCSADDPDFIRHIGLSSFFRKHSIPVPVLFKAGDDNCLFEDLGDMSLYSWLRCPRGDEDIEKIYLKVMDVLMEIHSISSKDISECLVLKERVFDYEHLRWETGYFIERFVVGIKGIEERSPSLNEEFHRLALKVDSLPKRLIHRDFQSQNIMLKDMIPRVIDYQGARLGPAGYDVASILWDPYHRLKDDMRHRLLDYYIMGMNKKAEGFNEMDFRHGLLYCRLQRHMQALGAYGFLSMAKGKRYFLKHVPEGLRLLKEDVTFIKDEYPELYRLVMQIEDS